MKNKEDWIQENCYLLEWWQNAAVWKADNYVEISDAQYFVINRVDGTITNFVKRSEAFAFAESVGQ